MSNLHFRILLPLTRQQKPGIFHNASPSYCLGIRVVIELYSINKFQLHTKCLQSLCLINVAVDILKYFSHFIKQNAQFGSFEVIICGIFPDYGDICFRLMCFTIWPEYLASSRQHKFVLPQNFSIISTLLIACFLFFYSLVS